MTFTILYVCTGNICRSPLAERYTVHRFAHAVPDVAHLVRVASAGVRGLEGHPMDERARQQLARHGGLGDAFAGRRLTTAQVQQADLVLAMTREHRAAAVTEAPSALGRSFTLLEAADVIQATDDEAGPGDLIAALSARRGAATLRDYDVADPIGQSARVHAGVADVIVSAVDIVVDGLAPSLRRLGATAPTMTPPSG